MVVLFYRASPAMVVGRLERLIILVANGISRAFVIKLVLAEHSLSLTHLPHFAGHVNLWNRDRFVSVVILLVAHGWLLRRNGLLLHLWLLGRLNDILRCFIAFVTTLY